MDVTGKAIDEISRLRAENAELKQKLMPCLNGDCILTCEVVEKYGKENAELKQKLEDAKATAYAESVDAGMENRRLKRALLLARAERYKMREFIAREEGNLCNQMSWSRILRERTYGQWVDQLLRIANLANKLQSKCRAKAEEYK